MAKKIAFTVSNDLTFDQRMIRICTSLQNAGYDCTLIGRKRKSSVKIESTSYQTKRLNLFFEKGKLFYLELNFRLFIHLLFSKYDAYCAIDCDTALASLMAKKLKGVPFVFDAHEIFAHTPEVKDRRRIQKIWLWVEKMSFAKSKFSYTVGAELAKHFEHCYSHKVSVIRNTPIPVSIPPSKIPQEKYILYQGALNKGRGLENAILAMKEIPLKLKIAGEGDLSDELRSLVVKNGLEQKVVFLGFVKPHKLPELSRNAWLGLNVSENFGLSYYLSLNNKLFDYMHAELPSLINPFPEYIAINRQFEIGVLTKSSVSDIVTNVNLLLGNEAKYDLLKSNCKKAKDVFNWLQEEKELVRLYKENIGE